MRFQVVLIDLLDATHVVINDSGSNVRQAALHPRRIKLRRPIWNVKYWRVDRNVKNELAHGCLSGWLYRRRGQPAPDII